jgi:putative hemolysin
MKPTAPTERLASDAAAAEKHIVDVLIEERCSHLCASPYWPLYRSFLYPLLRYPEAVRLADRIAHLPAREIFEFMSDLLRYEIVASGLEHIPEKGRVIIASTHPTGIADGIAMYDALNTRRPDLAFYANRDAIRVAPLLAEMLIPVEWVAAKRTHARSRETLVSTVKAFTDDRCIVLFPSGRLAFMNEDKTLTEQPWQASVAIFARKYECPIIPTHMTGRNSSLYYWFWRVNTELRDITLFNELLNKRGKRVEIRFGPPIMPDELPADAGEATEALREHAASGVPAGRSWKRPPKASL